MTKDGIGIDDNGLDELNEHRRQLQLRKTEFNKIQSNAYAVASSNDEETALLLIEHLEKLALPLNISIILDIVQIQLIIRKQRGLQRSTHVKG